MSVHSYKPTYQWADQSLVVYARVYRYHIEYDRKHCGYMQTAIHNEIAIIDCTRMLYSFLCEVDPDKSSAPNFKTRRRITLMSPQNTTLIISHRTCRKGHFTHDFLACDSFADCWAFDAADVSNDVSVISFHAACPASMTSFSCETERVRISYSMVCDSRVDCPDSSDELFCSFPPCVLQPRWRCEKSEGQVGESDTVFVRSQ